jgi:hypothetical protein
MDHLGHNAAFRAGFGNRILRQISVRRYSSSVHPSEDDIDDVRLLGSLRRLTYLPLPRTMVHHKAFREAL